MEGVTSAESPIYRDLMRLKPEGWTANAWAVRAGVSRTVWTDMRRHGNPSRRTLEKLLTVAGSSLVEFEALRIHETPAGIDADGRLADVTRSAWPAPSVPGLPLIEAHGGSRWGPREIQLYELRLGEIVQQLSRPERLRDDTGAYALTVCNDAMWPRFRRGRRIAVSSREPVAAGDDVILVLAGDDPTGQATGILAELTHRSSTHVELRQFNPDFSFQVDSRDIASLQKVVGELI